jgi:hypothetical protein
MDVPIRINPPETTPGSRVTFTAEVKEAENFEFLWEVVPTWEDGEAEKLKPHGPSASWTVASTEGVYAAHVVAKPKKKAARSDGEAQELEGRQEFEVVGQRVSISDTPLVVTMQRPDVPDTPDQALWPVIRHGAAALAYDRYEAVMDALFCSDSRPSPLSRVFADAGLVFSSAASPYPDMYSYKVLKVATETFLMANTPVDVGALSLDESDIERLGLGRGTTVKRLAQRYLKPIRVGRETEPTIEALPYLAAVRRKLPEISIRTTNGRGQGFLPAGVPEFELCDRILQEKLTAPTLIELIWSYWHEEGGLVQTLNAISMRFQNRRGRGDRDPLANLTIDPLRPLNNLLWGYIQDEQHRLTLARRAYEYDHEYGLSLVGRAVPELRSADPRSRFLEAFHNLLTRAAAFYREEDDTTTIADAFPVLNGLREVHLLLSEGAHNQYGDLPWTARHEMLMQQWLLARPEFREFLPTRVMVVYPEPWMDRVDAMKRLQGWTEVSIRHFRDLGVFGEQILLSIRFGNWSAVTNRAQAANWARYWREEVQWYIHSYAAVTGVDLSVDVADIRPRSERYLAPAVHLQRRQVEQRRAIEQPVPAGNGQAQIGAPASAPAPRVAT